MVNKPQQSLYIKAGAATLEHHRSRLHANECYLETRPARQENMFSFTIVFILVTTVISLSRAGGDGGHDHVIIHVPYHIKTIKHTHTITKHIHHKDGGGGDKYEVLGYTYGRPIELGGHGGGHGNHGGAWANEFEGHEMGSELDSGYHEY